MSQEQEKKKFWIKVSAYYQKQLPDHVLLMYADDCKEVSINELAQAFRNYRNSDRAQFFPLPGVLKKYLKETVAVLPEAQEVASKVFEAIRRFGYMRGQEAREFMGELAWECVQAFGGWDTICTSDNIGSEASVRAQLRDTAKAKLERAQEGRGGLKPGDGVPGLGSPDVSEPNNTALEASNVADVVSLALDGKKPTEPDL